MNGNKNPWIPFVAAFIGGLVAAMCQMKVPPVMPVLIETLHISKATGGMLMGVFAIAGIILAIPAAVILRRFGPKVGGLIALSCAILGSVVGAVADSAAVLMIGRMIEGVSMGLIAVVAPALITMLFPADKRGLPMGLWTMFLPVGSLIMFNVAAPLVNAYSWHGVWWFMAIVSAVGFVIYAAAIPSVKNLPSDPGAELGGGAEESTGKLLLNRNAWLLGFVYLTANLAVMGFLTWAPSYLQASFRMVPESANLKVSLVNIALIPGCIITGLLLNALKNRKFILLPIVMLIFGIVNLWAFNMPVGFVTAYILLWGFFSATGPVCAFTLAPETMKSPAFAGVAMAILAICQNLGLFIGAPLVGGSIEKSGWGAGIVPMVGALAVGLVVALFVRAYRGEQLLSESHGAL